MPEPIKIILDTDPGLGEPGSDIDDGLAIALALRSPEVDLLGLTIVNGNVDAPTGTDVARRLAERLGVPDLPVLQGATEPLTRGMQVVRDLFEAAVPGHRSAGDSAAMLGPTSPVPAADWMIEQVRRQPGEVVVVAIGPMTNLALAIRKDAEFAGLVKELVVMAGSATGYAQNVTVVGDFNAFVDPEALQVVLESGAPIRMVGLDQTSQVRMTYADSAALRAAAEAAGDGFGVWAAACTDAWIAFLHEAFPRRPEHVDGCFLHDPLVLAAVIDPSLCTWEKASVRAVTDSEQARGLVLADRGLALEAQGPINATVATATDVDGFLRLFLDRMGAARAASASSLIT
ncbi:MAG: nucleoside hydrolase [Naasia sp.]|nr:nucleoside hydrolase [Naasia sp.]